MASAPSADWAVQLAEAVAVVGVAAAVRAAVGIGGYSGAGTPPMFGDFEAQRQPRSGDNDIGIGIARKRNRFHAYRRPFSRIFLVVGGRETDRRWA